jgi:hypothetical protein
MWRQETSKGDRVFVYWTYWLCVKANAVPERNVSRTSMQSRIDRSEPRSARRRSLVSARSSSTAGA